jgi:hypothetical protein
LLIGFIGSLVTHSLLITIKYTGDTALSLVHTFQFTVVHALGFSVSTSRLLATDLHSETSTQITTSITLKIFQLHFQYHCNVAHIKSSTSHNTSSQADLLYYSVDLVPLRLLPPLVPLLIFLERLVFTWKLPTTNCLGQSESESYVTTDGQSASLSWYKAPIRGLRPDFFFRSEYGIRLTVSFFILWDTLSDERTGLSFVCAAGPCQHSLSRS